MEKHERNLLRYLEDVKSQSLRQLSEGIKYANQIINKEKLSIQSGETLSFFQKLAELHKLRAKCYKNQAEINSDLSVGLSAYEDLFKASCILGFWDKSLASDRKHVLPLISGQLTKSQGQPAVFARAKKMLKKLEECGQKTLIEGDKAGAMFIYQDAAELGKYLLHLQKECPDTQQLAAKCHVSYAEILYNMGFDKVSCQEKGHHLETALKACMDGMEIIQSKCIHYGANGHMGQLHFWKANILRCQKKYSEAMDAVNLAIECDSKNEDFLYLKYAILEECEEFCFTETHESEAFSEEIPDLASSEKEYSSIMSEKLVDTRTYANVTTGLSRENLSRSDSIASLSSVTSSVKIPGVNLNPAEPVSSACAVASSKVPSVQEKEFRKFQIFETCGQCYKEDHKRLVARQINKCVKRNHTWNPVFVCKDNVEPSCQYVQIRKPLTQMYFIPRLCKYLNTKWGCIKKACNYAHSEQEMLVWTWMKRNRVSELTDALQASERYFQTVNQCPRSSSKKPSIKHVSAKIPVSQAHFYECGVCCKKWTHRSEFDQHLNSEKHFQQLRASQSWTHRCPPDIQQYTLCDQHMSNKSCQYSNVVSQYNFCQHAHSREELKEWEERKRENEAFHSLKKEEHRDFYELYKNILHCQTKPNKLKELVTDTCVQGVKVEVKPSLGSTTGPMELHQQHQVQEGRTLQWNFQVKIKDKTKRLQKVYLLRDKFRSHFHFINKSENAQKIQLNSDSGSKYVFGVEFSSHGQQGAFEQWLILDFGDRPVLRKILKVDAETDTCEFNTEDASQAGSNCSIRLRQPACMNNDAEDESDEKESSVFEELAAKYPIVDWPLCYSHSGVINFFSYKSMMHTYLEEQKRKEMEIVHGKATILSLKLHKQLPVKIHESKHKTDGCIFGEVKQDLCNLEPDLCHLLLTAVSKVYLQPAKGSNTGHICKATVLNYADYLATGTPRKALYIRMSQKCATRLKLEGDVATLRMQFVFNTTLFDLMHHSLERTQNCLLFPDWNVPMAAVLPGKLRFKPNELSEEKRKCIEHILCQAPGNKHVSPFVVTGPSGSGKSFTIQQAIALLAKDMKRKVLICCKKSSDVDAYVMDLDRRISGGMLPYTSRPLRILGLSSPGCLQPEVVQYCSQHPSPTQKEVDEHRIIVATLTASLLLRRYVNKLPAFTHVIIDGMDKAQETESIIPLMYAECTQTIVVLTVDPMMCVSPSVDVTPRSTSQNELSLFLTDRLKTLKENENQTYLFPLRRLSGKSFDIIQFLSNAFYDGKLEVENEYPGSPSALSFYYKRGLETPQGLSYFNEAEAKEVLEVAQEIAAFSEDIAVISPFLAQVNLLEKYFDGLPKPMREKVTILSLESVPGTQFESALLSTVRTPRYVTSSVDFGSLEERKTLNSVFACARLHIVVFGDPFLLAKANQNGDVWKNYFRICDEKGTLSPEDLCFEKIDNLQMFTQPCAKYKPPAINGKRKKLSHDGISADKGVLSDSEGDFGEIGTEPDSLAEKVVKNMKVNLQRAKSKLKTPHLDFKRDDEKPTSGNDNIFDNPNDWKKGRNLYCESGLVNEIIDDEDFLDETYQNYLADEYMGDKEPFYEDLPKEDLRKKLQEYPEQFKHCILYLEASQKAYAVPIDQTETIQRIELFGRNKCGMAFNESEVVVELLNPPKGADVYIGKVIGVWRQTQVRKYARFACIADHFRSNLMLPLCNTFPKIHIYNKDAKNQNEVAIYSLDSTGQPTHKETELLNVHSREHTVFVVRYLQWDQYHYYPLGVVVKKLAVSEDWESRLDILKIQYNLNEKFPAQVNDTITAMSNEEIFSQLEEDEDGGATFTIDPPRAKDLDDALSVECLGGKDIRIGVHIADVSLKVKKNKDNLQERNPIDTEAEKRGETYYPSIEDPPVPMLPEKLSAQACSLIAGHVRPVISVFFYADRKSGELYADRPTEIRRTTIRSQRQLTYEEANAYISSSDVPEEDQNIAVAVRLLYKVAKELSAKRLGDVLLGSKAQSVVEEFMVLTNKAVAKELLRKYPMHVPLRVQASPNSSQLEMWKDSFAEIAMHSSKPRQWLRRVDPEFEDPKNLCYMPIRQSTWEEAHLNAVNPDCHFETLRRLFAYEKLHPLQCSSFTAWIAIQRKAKMVCSGSIPDDEMAHFDLEFSEYTRFTSPIRRYIDIVVHRLVVAMLEDQEKPPYTQEEIQEICDRANSSALKAKQFDRSCKMLKFSLMLKENKFMSILPVVTRIDDRSIQLTTPGLQFVSPSLMQLPYNHLGVCERPSVPHQVVKDNMCTSKEVSLIWNKKIFDIDSKVKASSKRRFEKDMVLQFNPYQFIYNVPISLWDQILKATKGEDKMLISFVKDCDKNVRSFKENRRGSLAHYVDNASAEMFHGKENKVISQQIKFKIDLNPGSVVQVLLSSKLKRGILQPHLAAFSLSENVHLCMQHRADPVDAFCKLSTARHLEETYKNVKAYQDTLLSLLQLEAAVSAVTNDESVSIQNVRVQWIKRENIYFGKFKMGHIFCEDRHIRLNLQDDSSEDFLESQLQDTKQYFDYLCIIYPQLPAEYLIESDSAKLVPASVKSKTAMWIAHGLVLHVEQKGALTVYFKLKGNDVPAVIFERSQDKNTALPCTVEIISKTLPNRRMEWAVRELSDTQHGQLPQNIALGNTNLMGNLEGRSEKEVESFFLKHEIDPEAEEERREWNEAEDKRIEYMMQKYGVEVKRRVINTMKNRDQRIMPYLENYLPKANPRQKEACIEALLKPFALIQGPPGTGKSLTGIRLVYLFVQWNREKFGRKSPKQILYCGPSNKSVDVVTDFLKRKFDPKSVNAKDKRPSICPRILRVYGDSIVLHDYPVPKQSLSWTEKEVVSTSAHKDVSLHHIIRKKGKPSATRLLKFDADFKKFFEDPVKYDVSDEDLDKYRKLVAKAEEEEIRSHDVILCTCTTSGTPKITGVSSFEQCIVDESGMCVEAESLIPIVSSKAKQVILIGDHKQLRPIIKNNTASEFGLARSLFERYASFADNGPAKVMLDFQYRMHPDICRFPSWEFYDGELKDGKALSFTEESALKDYSNLAKGLWYQTKGYKFLHIEGEQEIVTIPKTKIPSKQNMDEVQEVARIYDILTSRDGLKIPKKNIMILTQYPAQAIAIQQKIRKLEEENFRYVADNWKKKKKPKNVKLVADIQTPGMLHMKWDIVIFSAVCSLLEDEIDQFRSDADWRKKQLGLPHVVKEQICDVAYRRARKKIIMIGNKTLLKCDITWRTILQTYEKERCVMNSRDFLSRGVQDKRFWLETRRYKFLHLEGEEESLVISTNEGSEMSKKNMKEVEEVVRIFDILTSKTGLNVPPATIMILSQYRAQVNAIRSKLEGRNANVSTVVASQGGEWDIVLFTTVCSIPEYEIIDKSNIGWRKRNLGFIGDAHQINVALTRARKCLIIIGNQKLLKCDKVWDKLLRQYQKWGCVINAEEFLPKGIKSTFFYHELPPRFKKKLLEGDYYKDEPDEDFDENFDEPIYDEA